MHWSNAKINKDITVAGKIYITDHKHIAIFGTKDYVGFGYGELNSNIYGKVITVSGASKVNISAASDINISASSYLNLEGFSGITVGRYSYGTTLPSSGVEGQVFFKLIS